jgi:hypothetical protein
VEAAGALRVQLRARDALHQPVRLARSIPLSASWHESGIGMDLVSPYAHLRAMLGRNALMARLLGWGVHRAGQISFCL